VQAQLSLSDGAGSAAQGFIAQGRTAPGSGGDGSPYGFGTGTVPPRWMAPCRRQRALHTATQRVSGLPARVPGGELPPADGTCRWSRTPPAPASFPQTACPATGDPSSSFPSFPDLFLLFSPLSPPPSSCLVLISRLLLSPRILFSSTSNTSPPANSNKTAFIIRAQRHPPPPLFVRR